jgi:UDP:flavonoid glycosyltransferase YjiC (YdhE family)
MLAWYVHHQGRGHAARALAFAAASPVPVTLVSELDLSHLWGDTVLLGPDVPAGGAFCAGSNDVTANGRLHWAPIARQSLAPRAAAMVEVLNRPGLLGLVTDVSVEAGLLARLCGLPVVAVHELGVRYDAAHELGRACAAGLLAPFPASLADPDVDPRHPHLFHAGFVPSHTATPTRTKLDARERLGVHGAPMVLVALGAGGHRARIGDIASVAAQLRDVQFIVVGDVKGCAADRPDHDVRVDGWVPDISDHLIAADVVLASAGASVVAEVAAAGRPLVCVPEARPFGEQHERARRLARSGVALSVSLWADHDGLAEAVRAALEDDGDQWARIDPGPGPAASVEWVLDRFDRVWKGQA